MQQILQVIHATALHALLRIPWRQEFETNEGADLWLQKLTPFPDVQDIFNLLPNIDAELNRSFAVKSNDMMLVVYVASLIRSILALHNLINNKVSDQRKKLVKCGQSILCPLSCLRQKYQQMAVAESITSEK